MNAATSPCQHNCFLFHFKETLAWLPIGKMGFLWRGLWGTLQLILGKSLSFLKKFLLSKMLIWSFPLFSAFSFRIQWEILSIKPNASPLITQRRGASWTARDGLTSIKFFRCHHECELYLSNTARDLFYYIIDKKYSLGSLDSGSDFYRKYFTKRQLHGNWKQKTELRIK